MIDLFDAIKNRRSVRNFKPQTVSQELIKMLLEEAGWAPSAHNAQPYRFIVITEPKVKKKLVETMAKAWVLDAAKDGVKIDEETSKTRGARFVNAPVLILAC